MGSGGWLGLESSGEPLPPQLQPKNSSKRLPTHSEGKLYTFLKEKVNFLLTCLGEYFEKVLVGCSPGLETSVCSKKPAQRRPLQAMAGKWRILAAEARICHGLAFCRFFVTVFCTCRRGKKGQMIGSSYIYGSVSFVSGIGPT